MRAQTSSVISESLLEIYGNVRKIFVHLSRVRNLPEDFVPSNKPALHLAKMHSFPVVLVNH